MPDGSVKLGAVVIPFGAESHEVFACFRDVFTMELQIEGTDVCYQPDVALLLDPGVPDDVVLQDGRLVDGLPVHGRGGEGGGHFARGVVRGVELVRLFGRRVLFGRLDISLVQFLERFLGLGIDVLEAGSRVHGSTFKF